MFNIDALSLSEKAAQLVFPRLGSNMPPPVTVAEDMDRFKRDVLDRCPVGGLVIFNGRLSEMPDALTALQERSALPLLVSTDMERGVGQQVRGATIFPHAMAFSSPELLERAARIQSREALACGIHITFAPDADVNLDPRNPIIATRAFSDDPHVAAEMVRAYIRGCREEGLFTTAKHFPGHGNTHQDSHEEMPTVGADRDALEAGDLVPFAAAIEAGVDLVMTAHVLYPALDPDHPATFSRRILHDLLRDEMGFRGAVVTDSLLMGAIRQMHGGDAGEQAVALVAAGVDILLDIPDPVAAADGLVRAVEQGRLSESLIDGAAARVLALKARMADRFGERVFADPSAAAPRTVVAAAEHQALAERVAREGVRIMASSNGALPIPRGAGEDVLAVLIKPHRSRFDPPEEPFGDSLREWIPGATYRQIGPEATESAYAELDELASRAKYIVLALVVKPAAWHAFGLRPEQDAFVRAMIERHAPVVLSLGSPYILDAYPNAAATLCCYSDVEVSQRAAAERLISTS